MSQRDTKDNENVIIVTLNVVQGLNEMLKQVQHDRKRGFSGEMY